ncbi:MAG: 1,4-alpha-glucan branching protein GlgB [Lachnospiraceae bacterium]|nr:1,4-alpha-glucan branching protein GlgB [Lachnospiraceae bacterium]
MDMYGFYTGQEFNAHEYLGAHPENDGTVFRTFAPSATKVSLLLNGTEMPMQRVYDGNFYELFVPGAAAGQAYEYRIYFQNGGFQDHSDPYGFQMELRPAHRSIVCDLSTYTFQDGEWMRRRSNCMNKPLNIYEMHPGSWRRDENGEMLSYIETAKQLIPYLQESGYNYVEFLPLCEHPCDESWGYQNTGFFAPTSRYGSPQELMAAIDLLHQNGIGVILDFVPVHFAVDAYGLAQYDGTALYEYPNSAVGVSEWGSYNFMHSRGEVQSFLKSAANYFLSCYHFDGLRIDAISRIIYWQGEEKRGENGNAIDFLRTMNQGLKERHRGIMLIAEDSSSYAGVTKAAENGGLGFDYKWDLGWMHDTLEYFQLPPAQRSEHYHKLTFSMMYFRNERYLLPFSHDEVVHGKATILQKMNGDYEGKFPQARALYLYMYVHPGKKLNFMGNEIGQLREWDEKREQDWILRKYPIHDSFYRFMSELNALYLTHPALSELDYREEGFAWIDCHQEEKCVYAISRKNAAEELIAIFNFSDREQRYTLPEQYTRKKYEMLLCTDWEKYGGNCPLSSNVIAGGAVLLRKFSGVLAKVR